MKINFNKPYLTGKEAEYVKEAMDSGYVSGNGMFTKKCQSFFEDRYGFNKCLLTTSCTDALEMASILIGIKQGDEVIMPSFTFVSTANAFVLRGAKIVFVDSRDDHPGMDEKKIEELITPRTKAIVPVHYAGVACDMDMIMDVARRHNLYVIEDAAQAIDGYFKGRDGIRKPLGSIGHLSAFSFHETKNIISGEGGMLVVNDEQFENRAEIIWEKGTNRSAFFRGEVDKYGWVDVGSSFLPSDIIAAFLWAQLENLDEIQRMRLRVWESYNSNFLQSDFKTPVLPRYSTNNAHMYYIVCEKSSSRTSLIKRLFAQGYKAVFHYQSLHQSNFYKLNGCQRTLENSDRYSNCLLRLPFYNSLADKEIKNICSIIREWWI